MNHKMNTIVIAITFICQFRIGHHQRYKNHCSSLLRQADVASAENYVLEIVKSLILLMHMIKHTL
jgi:hypothetical protein